MDSFAAGVRRRVVRDVRNLLKKRGREIVVEDDTPDSVLLITNTVSYEICSNDRGDAVITVALRSPKHPQLWDTLARVEITGLRLELTLNTVVDMFAEEFIVE